MGEGPGASLLGLFGKRWVLMPPPQSFPEKSLPSLLLLFVSCKEGADGLRARQGACPPWGGGSVLQAAAVPRIVSLSWLLLPKAEGFCCQVGLGPLGLCQHGLSLLPLLLCVTSGSCCDTYGWVAWPRFWGRWLTHQDVVQNTVVAGDEGAL